MHINLVKLGGALADWEGDGELEAVLGSFFVLQPSRHSYVLAAISHSEPTFIT